MTDQIPPDILTGASETDIAAVGSSTNSNAVQQAEEHVRKTRSQETTNNDLTATTPEAEELKQLKRHEEQWKQEDVDDAFKDDPTTAPTWRKNPLSKMAGQDKVPDNAAKKEEEKKQIKSKFQREKERLRLLGAEKMQKGEFIRGETGTFDLGLDLDVRLYNFAQRINKTIAEMKAKNPLDPQLTIWQEMLNDSLNGDSAVSTRADIIQGHRGGTLQIEHDDGYRIFRNEQDIIKILGVMDQHELMISAAYAARITNNGQRPIELTLPANVGEWERMLAEAVPGFQDRVNTPIKAVAQHIYQLVGEKKIAAAITTLGVLGPDAVLAFSGGSPEAALAIHAAQLLGAGGAAYAINYGSQGEQKLTINFSSLPAADKTITEYAETFGNLDNVTKTSQDLAEISKIRAEFYYDVLELPITTPEGVRQPIYQAMLDMDPHAFDPRLNPTTLAGGEVIMNIHRQTALKELLDGGAEYNLETILQAYDMAATQMCTDTATRIAQRITGRGETLRISQAEKQHARGKSYEDGEMNPAEIDENEFKKRERDKKKKEETYTQLQTKQTNFNTLVQKTIPTAADELQDAEDELAAVFEEHKGDVDPSKGLSVGTPDELAQAISQELSRIDTEKQTAWSTATAGRRTTQPESAYESDLKAAKAALNPVIKAKAKKEADLAALKTKRKEFVTSTFGISLIIPVVPPLAPVGNYDLDNNVDLKIIQDRIREEKVFVAEDEFDKAKVSFAEVSDSEDNPRKPDAPEDHKEIGKAMQLLANARLIENSEKVKGRYNHITDTVRNGEANPYIRVDQAKDGDTYDGVLQLAFGDDALLPENRRIAERANSRTDIIFAVRDFYRVPDRQWGYTGNGVSKIEHLRQNLDNLTRIEAEIAKVKRDEPDNTTKLDKLQKRAPYLLAEELYGIAQQHWQGDRVEASMFFGTLVDRFEIKRQADNPFAHAVFAEMGPMSPTRPRIREFGHTVQTEQGRVHVEGPEGGIVEGIETYHARTTYQTPANHEPIALDMPSARIALTTDVIGKAGEPDSLKTTATATIDADFYNAAGNTIAAAIAQGIPAEIQAQMYDAAGAKKPHTEIPRQITLELIEDDVPQMLVSMAVNWNLFNLNRVYPQSVGRMVTDLGNEKREEQFSTFGTTNIAVPGTGWNFQVQRDTSKGKIYVSGGPLTKQTELQTFMRDYEVKYRQRIFAVQIAAAEVARVAAIAAGNKPPPRFPYKKQPLTQPRMRRLKREQNTILESIGTEALQSLQRY